MNMEMVILSHDMVLVQNPMLIGQQEWPFL